MTTTALQYREESLAHDDASVRILHLANGMTMTVATNPDTDSNYCLTCHRIVVPLAVVTVIDSEQWDYPADGNEGRALCPLCLETDLCREADADAVLGERAADADADRREQERKDEGWR